MEPYIFLSFAPSDNIPSVEYLSRFLYHHKKQKLLLFAPENKLTNLQTNVVLNPSKINRKFNEIFYYLKKPDISILKNLKKKLIILIKNKDDVLNQFENKFKKCHIISYDGLYLLKFFDLLKNNEKITIKITYYEKKLSKNVIKTFCIIGNQYGYEINPYYIDFEQKFTSRIKYDMFGINKSINITYFGNSEVEYKLQTVDNNGNIYQMQKKNLCNIKEITQLYDNYIKKKDLKNNLDRTIVYDAELFKKTKINRDYIAKYIYFNYLKKNNIPKMNNAFIKLYEVMNEINLFEKKDDYLTVHLAELPGGFIYATNAYLNKIGAKIHNWFGNSYNPEKIPQGFDDKYGLVKKYPNNWLWGKDGTGDITKIENIENIKEKIGNKSIDLITMDGGLGDDVDLIMMQKLDFAQMLVVAMLGTSGCNCVVKTFGNFIYKNPKSYLSVGLYIDILLIYSAMFETVTLIKPPNSSANSSEFYVVGKNFKPLDNELLNNLKNHLRNFELNSCFIKKNRKTDETVINIHKFYSKLLSLVNEETDKQIFIVSNQIINENSIYYDEKFNKECIDFLNNDKLMYYLGNKQSKLWCEIYDMHECKITL